MRILRKCILGQEYHIEIIRTMQRNFDFKTFVEILRMSKYPKACHLLYHLRSTYIDHIL